MMEGRTERLPQHHEPACEQQRQPDDRETHQNCPKQISMSWMTNTAVAAFLSFGVVAASPLYAFHEGS